VDGGVATKTACALTAPVKFKPEKENGIFVLLFNYCEPIATLLNPLPATFAQLINAPTCTGLDLFAVSPKPNCPSSFLPQNHMVPSVLMALP
jgi:hypothetical protein